MYDEQMGTFSALARMPSLGNHRNKQNNRRLSLPRLPRDVHDEGSVMSEEPTPTVEIPPRKRGQRPGIQTRNRIDALKKRMEVEKKMAARHVPPPGIRKIAGIGRQIALVPGGIREFMKWAKGAAMRDKRFTPVVEAFDSLMPSRQNAPELESLCITLGVPPYDLLGACVTIGAERQRDETRLIASLAMPKVMRVNIKQAQKPRSVEDRKMFMQATGILPVSKGSIINVAAQANVTNSGESSGLPNFEDSVCSFSEIIRNAIEVPALLPEPSDDMAGGE